VVNKQTKIVINVDAQIINLASGSNLTVGEVLNPALMMSMLPLILG